MLHAATSATLIDPASPTVLVIEDDPANRALLTAQLERAGYRAVTAADGPSGLAAALETAPDVVLLDIGLPGMDGLEICRRLRADPRTVAMPVVLLTGRTSVDDVVAGLDAGADDFLAKPFHEAELLARLRSARRLALVMAEMESAQGVVAALANAVEAKDTMTEHHCQRLAGLAHLLATAAELDPVSIKGVVFGALLHDIGKIGVSDGILKKTGALTDDEWIEMRRHPIIGEQICRPLASSREFAPIVRHHHERWDGGGYPDRLKGEEIPIGARIVGLVDAFDAIVHDRPYRQAGSIENAIAEIVAEAGHHFDPDLVERFAAMAVRRRPRRDGRPVADRLPGRAASLQPAMTLADVLTLALGVAYLSVLVIAVNEYRRRREPVSLAVVTVFFAVFVLFAVTGLGRLLPELRMITAASAYAAFLGATRPHPQPRAPLRGHPRLADSRKHRVRDPARTGRDRRRLARRRRGGDRGDPGRAVGVPVVLRRPGADRCRRVLPRVLPPGRRVPSEAGDRRGVDGTAGDRRDDDHRGRAKLGHGGHELDRHPGQRAGPDGSLRVPDRLPAAGVSCIASASNRPPTSSSVA